MTHRDRVRMALSHETPDRPPFQAGFTPEFASRLREALRLRGGLPHNPHGGGNTYDLERALEMDMILTSVGWANSYYRSEEPYTDEWGVGWRPVSYATRFGRGVYTEIAGHPLADDDAIATYASPDPRRADLYADAERALRDFGGERWIVGVTVTTVFECAWALRGLERLLLDLLEDPDRADAILEIPHRYHLEAAKRLVHLGVDMIWIGDDVGTQRGMLIAPEMWRRFLKPRMAAFIAEIRDIRRDIVIAYHSDGDIRPIIGDLIEVGVNVLNPVQPGCMDPAALKREYGDRLSFWGAIDEQHTLPFGTPADVAREARERIETLGAGGGYIIGPTHNVQLDTPIENFFALVHAVMGARG